MNIFLSEKPVDVRVIDYTGGEGAELPGRARYTYSLDIEPDEVWMLCWKLPSTLKHVPPRAQGAVEIRGEFLSFTCLVEEHDERRAEIAAWITEANRQKDELLSAQEKKSVGPDERRAVLDRLTSELRNELGIGGAQDETRLEAW